MTEILWVVLPYVCLTTFVRNRCFWRFLGMAGIGVVWPSTRSGQRELDSVKTDLIAVERNLVSGNKLFK